MASVELCFNYCSSNAAIESKESNQEGVSFDCSTATPHPPVKTNEPNGQAAKRPRNQEQNMVNIGIQEEDHQSLQLNLLKTQIDIQNKLFDTLSKSLEENKENSKSMRYNTRKMYEALEGIKLGSAALVSSLEAQIIESARHNKVMENMAREELKLNKKMLELKLKKLKLLKIS